LGGELSLKKRLVVGITGSSGVIMGIRLLEALRNAHVETHLIITPAARLTIEQETRWKADDVLALADVHYNPRDIGAAIASGSFVTAGMVVIPCSIKSLSAIANSYAADLLSRAADVTLKEGRPLLLVVRETPLHLGHIRLLGQAAEAGAIIFPPAPAFYTHPQTVDEMVDNLVGRVLLRLGIENELFQPWQGVQPPEPVAAALAEAAWPPAELLALPAMTLATASEDGAVHAAAVYFAAGPDNCLVFFSEPDSQHARDLAANPQAAATIQPQVSAYTEIRGLQLRGRVRPLAPGPEWEQAFALYQAKFAFVAGLADVLAKNTLYQFTPGWIRLVDNRRGFGFKEEKNLE
jgi:4-hydroxy-3-polyprenylbenzoate decarboxylase